MASALAHLHKHGVAHLDVKADNIYLQVGPYYKLQWVVRMYARGVEQGCYVKIPS